MLAPSSSRARDGAAPRRQRLRLPVWSVQSARSASARWPVGRRRRAARNRAGRRCFASVAAKAGEHADEPRLGRHAVGTERGAHGSHERVLTGRGPRRMLKPAGGPAASDDDAPRRARRGGSAGVGGDAPRSPRQCLSVIHQRRATGGMLVQTSRLLHDSGKSPRMSAVFHHAPFFFVGVTWGTCPRSADSSQAKPAPAGSSVGSRRARAYARQHRRGDQQPARTPLMGPYRHWRERSRAQADRRPRCVLPPIGAVSSRAPGNPIAYFSWEATSGRRADYSDLEQSSALAQRALMSRAQDACRSTWRPLPFSVGTCSIVLVGKNHQPLCTTEGGWVAGIFGGSVRAISVRAPTNVIVGCSCVRNDDPVEPEAGISSRFLPLGAGESKAASSADASIGIGMNWSPSKGASASAKAAFDVLLQQSHITCGAPESTSHSDRRKRLPKG